MKIGDKYPKHVELLVCNSEFQSLPALTNMYSVLANYPEGVIWIVENHLNLVSYYLGINKYSSIDKMNIWIDFSAYDGFYIGRSWERCWMLRKKVHLRDYVDLKWNGFCEFCMDSIARGLYVFVTVNTKYISQYNWNGRHQLFIHGYDSEKKQLLCSDFFGIPAKYSRQWINFGEIEAGYAKLSEISTVDDFEGICLWEYNASSFCFDFEYGIRSIDKLNYGHIYQELECFIKGINEYGATGSLTSRYGLNVYKMFSSYIYDTVLVGKRIMVQPLYVLKDHLITIRMLANELSKNGVKTDLVSIQKAIDEWERITKILLKYNATNMCHDNSKLMYKATQMGDLVNEFSVMLSTKIKEIMCNIQKRIEM